MSVRINCSQLLRNFIYENCFSAFWFFRSISECFFGLDHGLDTVVHILNEVLLGAAESTSVGDIEDAVAGVRVLTSATADLDVELIGNLFKLFHVLAKLGKMDMDRGSKSGSKVSGA